MLTLLKGDGEATREGVRLYLRERPFRWLEVPEMEALELLGLGPADVLRLARSTHNGEPWVIDWVLIRGGRYGEPY